MPSVAEVKAPLPGHSWHWQLSGAIDPNHEVDVYDIDLDAANSGLVDGLHSRSVIAICYISAGSWENWRSDADVYPAEILGTPLAGWPDERWVDIRRIDVVGPILEARLDRCAALGFDGVEWDNVDGWQNPTGFPLTADDQLVFNRFVAEAAHARGLSVGLKNDLDQAVALEPYFDWLLVEECVRYDECDKAAPFVDAGKAVFHVEYEGDSEAMCAKVAESGFSSTMKRLTVDEWASPCW